MNSNVKIIYYKLLLIFLNILLIFFLYNTVFYFIKDTKKIIQNLFLLENFNTYKKQTLLDSDKKTIKKKKEKFSAILQFTLKIIFISIILLIIFIIIAFFIIKEVITTDKISSNNPLFETCVNCYLKVKGKIMEIIGKTENIDVAIAYKRSKQQNNNSKTPFPI